MQEELDKLSESAEKGREINALNKPMYSTNEHCKRLQDIVASLDQ